MLEEMSVERFRFSCPCCRMCWVADHELRHVEVGHGVAWDGYSPNGSRATAHTARGVICCPDCGVGRIHVELVSTRVVVPGHGPLVSDEPV